MESHNLQERRLRLDERYDSLGVLALVGVDQEGHFYA
jgi:hypothetical protein